MLCIVVININVASLEYLKEVVPVEKQYQAHKLKRVRELVGPYRGIQDALLIAPDLIRGKARITGPEKSCKMETLYGQSKP